MAICFLGVAPLETESSYSKHSPLLVGDRPDHAFEYHRLRHLHRSGEKSRARIRCGLDEHFSSGHVRHARVGCAGRAGMFHMARVSAVAPYTVFDWVLRCMEPSRVAAENYIQPVIDILSSIRYLGEYPT
jgi:hypothetical protein